MYKNILLPTKGGKGCLEAFKEGLKLAKIVGAKVTIVNVQAKLSILEILDAYQPDLQFLVAAHDAEKAQISMAHIEELHRNAGEHFVSELKKLADEMGVDAKTVVIERASPEEGISMAASENGCDLIFMASHSEKGISGTVLGSITTKVVAHSTIPVLVQHC